MNKVWIVRFDGYLGDYGSYNYLLGIYDTEELANQAVQALIKQHDELKDLVFIYEVIINKTLDTTDMGYEIITDIYLGGYAE